MMGASPRRAPIAELMDASPIYREIYASQLDVTSRRGAGSRRKRTTAKPDNGHMSHGHMHNGAARHGTT